MEWGQPVHPESLLAQLRRLPDPRRRQGRRYPLAAIVGLLVLAAMHGETSVRGMWLWGSLRWPVLWEPLGFWTAERALRPRVLWRKGSFGSDSEAGSRFPPPMGAGPRLHGAWCRRQPA